MAKQATSTTAERSHDTRQALLNAASALLRERHGDEPPISEIAARAGANAALVGYYFGSKDGLFRALLEAILGPRVAEVKWLTDAPLPPAQKLRIHIAGVVNTLAAHPYLERLTQRVIANADGATANRLAEAFLEPTALAYRAIVEAGVRACDFRPVDPMLLYYSVIGACDRLFAHGYTLAAAWGVDSVDDDLKRRFTEHTTNLILRGLREEGLTA